jgi:MoaA/NifB/PqqE/SkfB family radical SAM enzyme
MNLKAYITQLLPKIINYRLSRLGLVKPANPITLTFSVTNVCQSKCHTCKIWELYLKNPEKKTEELTLEEIENVFKSLGHIYFLNISGGEPFLRKDLPKIIELAMKYLKPGIVHSPTNAIAVDAVERQTRRILEIIHKYNPKVPFTIKPSFDGIGEEHDRIRGIKGNFDKVLETIKRLKKINEEYPNLHIELGTVVSNENLDHLDEIADYAHSLGVESYRNEIAEQRAEFFNKQDPITPTGEQYQKLMKQFSEKIKQNIYKKRKLTRLTESLRLVYYQIASEIMLQRRQVIPCYGGISNVHMSPYGDLWPCCVLGYDKSLGNVKDVDYDFKKIWHSDNAKEIRNSIKRGECWCPLANQAYSNILISPRTNLMIFNNIMKYMIFGKKKNDDKS